MGWQINNSWVAKPKSGKMGGIGTTINESGPFTDRSIKAIQL